MYEMNCYRDPHIVGSFIQLVEKYPPLYDPSVDGYCDRELVDRIWAQIAENFNESVPQVKERWKNIRSSYVRWLRLDQTTGTGRKKKPYYLAKYLHFLEPHTRQRSNLSTENGSCTDLFLKSEIITDDSQNGDGQEDEDLYDINKEDSNIDSKVHTQPSPAKMPKVEENFHVAKWSNTGNFSGLFARHQSSPFESCSDMEDKKEESPDSLFFKSILPKVEKLKEKQKLELQVLLLQKIMEYNEQNEKDSDT